MLAQLVEHQARVWAGPIIEGERDLIAPAGCAVDGLAERDQRARPGRLGVGTARRCAARCAPLAQPRDGPVDARTGARDDPAADLASRAAAGKRRDEDRECAWQHRAAPEPVPCRPVTMGGSLLLSPPLAPSLRHPRNRTVAEPASSGSGAARYTAPTSRWAGFFFVQAHHDHVGTSTWRAETFESQ